MVGFLNPAGIIERQGDAKELILRAISGFEEIVPAGGRRFKTTQSCKNFHGNILRFNVAVFCLQSLSKYGCVNVESQIEQGGGFFDVRIGRIGRHFWFDGFQSKFQTKF
jgi:hypothetical protein